MAEWQRKNAWWWSYRNDPGTRPYGNVVRCRTDGMDGASWVAIRQGRRDGDHTVLARRSSLEGATQALERSVARHGHMHVRRVRRVRGAPGSIVQWSPHRA